jgi:hypothetical protein
MAFCASSFPRAETCRFTRLTTWHARRDCSITGRGRSETGARPTWSSPPAYPDHAIVLRRPNEFTLETARRKGVKFRPSLTKRRRHDVEIRRVICSTNAIESLNARYRRAIKARGHFPSEQAALKCLYLVTRSLDPTGVGRARWVMR